nr:unnamed protein product [Callosobruchus chinensis]
MLTSLRKQSESSNNKTRMDTRINFNNKLVNSGKIIENLKDIIGKLKRKSVVSEKGIQTDMTTESVYTQTHQSTTKRETMCILTKEDKYSDQNSFNKQDSIPTKSLLGITDTSVNHQVESTIDDVTRVKPPIGPSVTIAPVAEKDRRIPSSRRKIPKRNVLELYADKLIFSVESFVRPNIEFLLATQDIFKITITHGGNDFVICMVSTQNIGNTYSLNKAGYQIISGLSRVEKIHGGVVIYTKSGIHAFPLPTSYLKEAEERGERFGKYSGM